MSTRCLIGVCEKDVEGNRIVNWTYCHFDGYPAGVGKILYEHYNNYLLASKLVTLNGFSSLENTYEKTKLEEYQDETDSHGTMYYHEWRQTLEWGADYIYTFWVDEYVPNGGSWRVRKTFGYDLEEIADENLWRYY